MRRVRKPKAKIDEEQVPKGYVPMLVGDEKSSEPKRILVRVSVLKDPCLLSLLEMAGEEVGYRQQGVLRIPCDAQQFRWIVNEISKAA